MSDEEAAVSDLITNGDLMVEYTARNLTTKIVTRLNQAGLEHWTAWQPKDSLIIVERRLILMGKWTVCERFRT